MTQATATTQQVPTSRQRVEITEEECLQRYGPLIWEALIAFATDAEYLIDIVNAANIVQTKRDLWASRSEEFRERQRLSKLRNRLGEKVEVSGQCWVWTASTTKKGTPIMRTPGTGKQPTVAARAWAVEQWHGADETRWMIQASCGNGRCVSPLHATWRHVERRH